MVNDGSIHVNLHNNTCSFLTYRCFHEHITTDCVHGHGESDGAAQPLLVQMSKT